LLQIKDLHVAYGQDCIIRGLDLDLATGSTLAIIGESGAGKTTIGLSIMGLLNGSARGTISLDGTNILTMTDTDLRDLRWKRISMSFQSAQNRLNPTHNILEQVAEPLTVHQICKQGEAQQRAVTMLRNVGISEDKLKQHPHQLSGGEQQRVLIAMALISNPEVLILDEPMSALDAVSRIGLLKFLKGILMNRTVITVTHDLSTASSLAAMTATLYGGRIVELGPTGSVLSYPRHPYTRALLRSYPDMNTTRDLQGIKGRMERMVPGCAFHPRCTQSIKECCIDVPEPASSGGHMIACHRGGIIPALSIHGLCKSFGRFQAVKNVSLTIQHGETVALVGQSGSGKTTLAKMITGILKPDAGEIRLEGKTAQQNDRSFHKEVQILLQNPGEALSHRLTVLESVREPLEIQEIGSASERDRIAIQAIGEVELSTGDKFLNEYPHHLSGGELQRVNLARSLVLDPRVLIADEPTSFLDPGVQAKVLKLLLNLQEKRGLSMLFITHDIAVARKISDRIAVMQDGQIIEQGLSNRLLSNPKHHLTQELISAAGRLDKDGE